MSGSPLNKDDPYCREWLEVLKHEITHMSGVACEGTSVQLAGVPGVHEQVDRKTSSDREKRGTSLGSSFIEECGLYVSSVKQKLDELTN